MTKDLRCRAWLHIAGHAPKQCTLTHDHDYDGPDTVYPNDSLHVSEDGWRWATGRKATPPQPS